MGLRIPKSDSAKMGMTRMLGKNRSKQRQQRGIHLISVFSAISCKVRFRLVYKGCTPTGPPMGCKGGTMGTTRRKDEPGC